MYILVDFISQTVGWRGGPLSHKQGGLIHQFGVLAWHDLKNKLLLLLLLYKKNNKTIIRLTIYWL
jgi:hypothetical protein